MEPQHLSFDDPESSGEQERGRPLNCDDLKNRFRNPSAKIVSSAKLLGWAGIKSTCPVRSIPKTWAAEPKYQTVSFWLAELELQAQLSAGTARLKVAQLGFRFRFSKF
ncbi:hypothetical protein D8674_029080 [Pyrus ussuriensis x Pyrus communis]|uniref:Uncharacterized protein n=1 Tax=Pyrus ussuriensis x Pyrus communis TaxID=2448454 RepID=A0A5N5I145_9ROSA|nr:hypothetical protein D8674_029080 [Pyrus ussuriensis x Pyrus communis]